MSAHGSTPYLLRVAAEAALVVERAARDLGALAFRASSDVERGTTDPSEVAPVVAPGAGQPAEAPLLFGGVLPGLLRVTHQDARPSDRYRTWHLSLRGRGRHQAWCGKALRGDPQWWGLTLGALREHDDWCNECGRAVRLLRILYAGRDAWTGERLPPDDPPPF